MIALSLSLSPCVRADSQDAFNARADYRLIVDDNIFRQPIGRTEQISSTSIGASFHKAYSLQEIHLDATYIDRRFKNFDYLSYGAFNYDLLWKWSVTSWVHGDVRSSQVRQLNNFADFRDPRARNIRTDRVNHVDGEVDLSRSFRLTAGLSRLERTNDLPVVQEGDSQIDSQSAGVKYVRPSGRSIGYRWRRGQGDYFNRVPSVASIIPKNFDEREHALLLVWPLTGKTDLDARIAHLQRTHPGVAQRDFAGTVGQVRLNWDITAKLGLTLSLARDLGVYQTDASSYTAINRLTLAPTWRPTAQTSLRLSYQRSSQAFGGSLQPVAQGDRHDDLHDTSLTFEWQPQRYLSFSASLLNHQRTSNAAGFNYKANGAAATARVSF